MKKPVICSFLLAAFLASCSTPASSSGSFSSSRPNSSSSSTSYVPYSSSSDEVLEEEMTPIIGYDEDARIDGNLLYGSDDRFPLRSEAPLERSQGGSLILEQGMILENDLAYSSIVGVRVQFVSTNSLDVLYAKGSYWSIDNGAIGAALVQSNVLCEFDQDTRYFSLYAPLGDVLIESITLYTSYTPDAMDERLDAIDFYTINDTHGTIDYNGEVGQYQLGIERLSTLYKKAYEGNPDGTVILSSGDMWQGSAMSNMSYGGAMIDWMNAVGFDAMSIGNHEFDWGASKIQENALKANFPFLGINVLDPQDRRPSFLAPSTVLVRGGVRIGVIGGIGLLEGSILPSSLGGYHFAYYSQLISDEAERLRIEEGCDLVVVSLHNGDLETRYCQNIDAVFLGHTHQDTYFVDNYGIPHLQTWSYGSNVRSARFVRTRDGWEFDGVEREYTFLDNEDNTPDYVTEQIVKHYDEEFSAVMDEVVGYSEEGIPQSELASLGAEALYDFYQDYESFPTPDIAIVNSGCARQDIVPGDITYGELYSVFPFDNDHVFATIDGRDLMTVASRNVTYPLTRDFEYGKTYTVVIISYAYERYDFYFNEIGRDSVNRLRDCAAAYFRSQA